MRNLTLFFALALAFQPMKLNSCGWDWSSESYRFWLLQPELAEARPLQAFYFTTYLLHGPDYSDIIQLPYAANLSEWQAIVGPAVPEDDIAAILYGMEPEDYFKQEAELFRTNRFMRRLAQMQRGWPAFISYAKRCEQLVNSSDPWGFIEHDGQGIRKAWTDGIQQLNAATDPALRTRLAFQLVRLAHHGHDPGRPDLDARSIYQRYLAPLRGKSWMEPSAAFYLAGMLENPERDLAFAEVFDRATDKQFRMVQLFVSGAVESYLLMAKDDKHRAALLVMRCLQHPGRALEDLERIAAWDPGNSHLPLLLSREVNKLEDWLLTPALTDFDAAIRQWNELEDGVTRDEVIRADLAYLHEVQAFIDKVKPQATAKQQALLTLLHGHLSFVSGDMANSISTMALVEKNAEATPMMRVQARMDRILCGIVASRKLTDSTREDILALVELLNTEPELFANRPIILGQLHLYLGKKLIARGELPEGIFLLARSERMFGTMLPVWFDKNARHVAFELASPADFDGMIALLDKPNKTAFELYLTATEERPADWEQTENIFKSNDLTREKLLDYKATWYVVRDRMEEALAIFQQIPDEFWEGYPYAMFAGDDPFKLNIYDPHNYWKEDHANYNKRSIVARMVALKKEAELNPKKRALNNYLLGNAHYNMSWHGKYWIMSRIAWSMWEMDQWRDRETSDFGDEDYYGSKRAKEYYLKASQSAKDPVLKAMAVRMLGKCEWNWLDYSGEGGLDEWENPYLGQLNSRKSRDAYRDIVECRGYADFVARYK